MSGVGVDGVRWLGDGCCQAAEADRRLARERSRNTAAVAATKAAATAIRVICQPGMPPPVMTVTEPVAAPLVQQSAGGRGCAKAAGAVARVHLNLALVIVGTILQGPLMKGLGVFPAILGEFIASLGGWISET